MGNFIFDQTFSKDTMQGLALGLILNKNKLQFFIFPVQSSQLQPFLISETKEKGKILEFLENNSNLANKELSNSLKEGVIILNYE